MAGNTSALTAAQLDRATGAIVGMAVGNALGNGYAFDVRPAASQIQMRAGGLGAYEEGEWADDTAMAMPILEALAAGENLLEDSTQDHVAARWAQWILSAKDVAPAIIDVLDGYDPAQGAQSLRSAAARIYAGGSPASAGNASLMRTTPIALGYLDDPEGLVEAARAYSDLTHANPQAAEACVLWNLGQRHAILTGDFDLAEGLAWLPEQRQSFWEPLINQAEVGTPLDFAIHNGWVSQALQTAWSAMSQAQDRPEQLADALRRVIAAGGDTATVTAIAGGMLGARWGVSAIPLDWRRRVHGWPGMRDCDLVRSAWEAVHGQAWPQTFDPDSPTGPAAALPADPGVWIGGIEGLRPLPAGVDAVISLCCIGDAQTPQPAVDALHHVNVWLIDSDDPADNPNLDMVAEQTVDMILELRAEGRTVYLHCENGRSRAPFIGALYSARVGDLRAAQALREIQQVMPQAQPNALFTRFLRASG
ncbi:MAG: ADP-ribosylglycohydrolase family protein [Candidatus Nanopelagicales bacterium]